MTLDQFIQDNVRENPRSPGFSRDEVVNLIRLAWAGGGRRALEVPTHSESLEGKLAREWSLPEERSVVFHDGMRGRMGPTHPDSFPSNFQDR